MYIYMYIYIYVCIYILYQRTSTLSAVLQRCHGGSVESESEKSDVQVSMNSSRSGFCRNPDVSGFKHTKKKKH